MSEGPPATRRRGDVPASETLWVVAAVLALVAALLATDALRRVDLLLYDHALRAAGRTPHPDVVIVAVDERSLQSLGRWPWSRRVHAALLDRLTRSGVQAVAFDVFFVEPETADREADQVFAAAIARNGRVVLPVVPFGITGAPPSSELRPLPELAAAAAALGHVDVRLHEDAVARSAALEAGFEGTRRPALALAAARVAGRVPMVPFAWNAQRAEWLRGRDMLVPFVGPPGTFPMLAYVDVLEDPAFADRLREKIVLVGPTAAGLAPAFATPVSGAARPMSGVEYDANVLQAILDGRWVEPLGPLERALLTAFAVVLPLLAYRRLGARATLLVVLLAVAGTLLIAHLLLGIAGLWFAPAAALVGLVAGQLLWSWRRLEHHRRALAVQMETERATLDSVGDAVVRTDRAGRVRFMNPVAQRLASQSGEEAIGRPFSEVFVPDSEDDRTRIEATIGGASEAAGGARTAQCSLRDRDGHRRTLQLTASFVHGAPGDDAGLVLAMSDVTAVVSLSEALAHQAMHDDLTRLPNRRLLLDRVEQALRLAARTHERVAVLFVDLDGFKRINDSLGHAAGDRVLQEVARRLAATRRGGDTVARWGGDEFVVVLEGLGRDASVGAIARKILAALSAPLACDDKEIIVTASIGVAVHPGDGDEAGLLLRHADMAMYGAKRQGRGRIRFHSEKAQESTARHFALEQDLRHAVRRDELELFYQPQLHCATGRVVGVEALIRWHHPQRGLLAPGAFIPVAEETGLIDEIGTWTLGEACRQAQRWAALGLTDITIAVNLSPRQIQRANIARSLERVLRESGVAATTIKLEVVETAVVHDLDRLEGALRAVRALGVHVAIDDFGTGYSSLIHLKRFPVDEVKIDQSFVRGIGDDTNDAAITAGVIAMAHSLGLRVVAEGVENEAQLGFLRERGCDEWQGYLCSRPLPAVELTRYLQAGQATFAPAPEGG